MPNLVKVVLGRNEWCRELPNGFRKSGGFPCLRYFIVDREELEEFPELEEGVMPYIEDLCLKDCNKLKKVGGALESLKILKVFSYSKWAKDLVETLKEGGEYCDKIKVINPHLTIRR
ncbi:hypothetical protein SUGI_0232550 [Cryptomeria japonica]|nr:hypothetical protein SUGI_0232550 [Cryptomeria japonica]